MGTNRMVRLRGGFSDRNNLVSLAREMQYETLDNDTRIILGDKVYHLFKSIESFLDYRYCEIISNWILETLFCEDVSKGTFYLSDARTKAIEAIHEGTYNEVFDVIEFIVRELPNYIYSLKGIWPQPPDFYSQLDSFFNDVFEQEYIGYRFLDKRIVRITNESEIEVIDSATKTRFDQVNGHIKKAIACISEKDGKDFENSIKESIMAVETLTSVISGKKKGTLGEAIDLISKNKNLHPAFREAILKLYGFASDEEGIRHGNSKAKHDVTFDEAKFILVICSGIVNYLISISR